MKHAALLVALLGLAGCGDNLPDPSTPRSGDRLKLAWYVYPDGTRQRETTWYFDVEVGARCTPRAWSDGHRYCAPDADDAVYDNPSCTHAIGRTLIGAEPKPYVTTMFYLLGSPLPSRVFRRGAPTTKPFTVFEKHHNGCIGPLDPGDDYDYVELGAEVEVVQMQRSAPRGDGELARVDELSADGLRVPVGFFDRTLEVECTPADRINVESVECVPNDSALVSYFHEVGCLEPELAVTDGSTPTTAKQYLSHTRCWSYYDVGAEVSAPPLYESLGGLSCVPVAPPGGAHFYLMAGPHQMQGLLRQRESTTRRLARIDLVRDDLHVQDRVLYDSELEVECERDAELRCAPATSAMIEPFFADAGCTMPLDLALVPSGDCDPPTKFARKDALLYPLEWPYTRTIHWLSTGDTCGVYTPPTPFVAWTIGPPIDAATLPHAELTIDP